MELAFKPELYGVNSKGLHLLVTECIDLGDLELKKFLYKNIFLSGGVSNAENFGNRINYEINAIAPKLAEI